MNKSTSTFSYLLFIVFTPLICFSFTYRITKLTPNTCTITISSSKPETKDSVLVCAIPSHEEVDIQARLLSSGSLDKSITLTSKDCGYSGNSFLRWFRTTLDSQIDEKTITFVYSQPIILPNDTVINTIQHGPLISINIHPKIVRTQISKPFIPFSFGLRMEIDTDGVYCLPAELLKRYRIPINSIKTSSYRLFCKNTEIPMVMTNPDHLFLQDTDSLLFFGKFLRAKDLSSSETAAYYSQYTRSSVYWLVWQMPGVGARYVNTLGWQGKDALASTQNNSIEEPLLAKPMIDTLHIEQDNDMGWLGSLGTVFETAATSTPFEPEDNWYWRFIGGEKLSIVTFQVPSPLHNSQYTARIIIHMMGFTQFFNNNTDHQFGITLNNQSINSPIAQWDGQCRYSFTSNPIESSKLIHGLNSISFTKMQNDTVPDRIGLNSIDIIYTRGFQALDNRITFKSTKANQNRWVQYDLTDFSSSNLELWDIATFRYFNHFNVSKSNAFYTLSFQDSISSGSMFWAQSKALRTIPRLCSVDTIKETFDAPEPLDYIMITPDSFKNELQSLADYHTAHSLKTTIFTLQDIYNRFSYGIHVPDALKAMLTYIFTRQNEHPPRFLLLAGDASHDYDKKDAFKNKVPTYLTQIPNWGPASDDGFFTKIKGNDQFSDLSVGRLPINTKSEMSRVVTKTLKYMQYNEPGYWYDNILLAGGVEHSFTVFNNALSQDLLNPSMRIVRIDADPYSPYYCSGFSASQRIADYINAGVYAINFCGHGGGSVWSDSKMFSYSDLTKLNNGQWGKAGKLPLVFSFTCLTGFFESVLYESLGEQFLRNSSHGCIAFYGASGYTKRMIDMSFSQMLLTNLLGGTCSTLGDLITLTESEMLVSHGLIAIPLVNQYNLLGDPAVSLIKARNSIQINTSQTHHESTDSIAVTGNTNRIAGGNVRISMVDDNLKELSQVISPVKNNTFTHVFTLKKKSTLSTGVVRAFAWNDTSYERGHAIISHDSSSLHSVTISPPTPEYGDTVSVSCTYTSPDTTSPPLIQCRYALASHSSDPISFDPEAWVFMVADSSKNRYKSQKPIVLPLADVPFDVSKQLILQFVSTSSSSATKYYSFPLQGRSDLVFTSPHAQIQWIGDSIRIFTEIGNKGTTEATDFLLIAREISQTSDGLLFETRITNPLQPHTTASFSRTIPDQNRTIKLALEINADKKVKEINYTNNTQTASFSISYCDVHLPSDTLYSVDSSYKISLLQTNNSTRRIFLLRDTIKKSQPLISSSTWLSTAQGGSYAYTIFARPPLTPVDTVQWIVTTLPPRKENSPDTTSVLSLFALDTSMESWNRLESTYDSADRRILCKTSVSGPCAAARLWDKSGPIIRAFVAGKEITFLDYTATGKPFSIHITDSSGVDRPSIRLLQNGAAMNPDRVNIPTLSEIKTSITLTAYPEAVNAIDSLTISASDNAGNTTLKTFAYRPGEKLAIRFFSAHPNPYTAKPGTYMRFAFLLTDIATEVNLSLFTISSRKVFQWHNTSDLIGYQEVVWDGTTENRRSEGIGYRIANGTYYAKLTVKNKKIKVEKIIRIVKLEGYND